MEDLGSPELKSCKRCAAVYLSEKEPARFYKVVQRILARNRSTSPTSKLHQLLLTIRGKQQQQLDRLMCQPCQQETADYRTQKKMLRKLSGEKRHGSDRWTWMKKKVLRQKADEDDIINGRSQLEELKWIEEELLSRGWQEEDEEEEDAAGRDDENEEEVANGQFGRLLLHQPLRASAELTSLATPRMTSTPRKHRFSNLLNFQLGFKKSDSLSSSYCRLSAPPSPQCERGNFSEPKASRLINITYDVSGTSPPAFQFDSSSSSESLPSGWHTASSSSSAAPSPYWKSLSTTIWQKHGECRRYQPVVCLQDLLDGSTHTARESIERVSSV